MNKITYLRTRCFREKCKDRSDWLYSNLHFTKGGYNYYAKYSQPCKQNTYKSIFNTYTKIRRYIFREIVHLDLENSRIMVGVHDIRGRIED